MEPEPALVPVKVTEQLVTLDTVDKVQDGELRLPPVVPAVRVKVTEPEGAFDAVVVSTTVAVTLAVQLLPPSAIVQLTLPTLVEVLSSTTVMALEVPVLPLCVESPPYVPVTVAVPAATPVSVAVHLPALKVQVVVTVATPVFDEVKPTLPVGTLEGVVVSETVAVQVEVPVGTIVTGLQAMVVDVLSLLVAVTVIVAEALTLEL